MEYIWFPLLAVLIGVLIYFAWRAERAREAAIVALAVRLGFEAHDEADARDDEYKPFGIFDRGHSRRPLFTLVGNMDVDGRSCVVRCGDFRYTITRSTGRSTSSTTHTFSYVIVATPWPTPSLVVRPEGIGDMIAGALGFDDIDFESAEFSRRFYVKSSDKKFAYDVLHPRMMEFLLAQTPPMLHLEEGAICLSDGNRRWDPEEFEAALGFLRKFFDQWPRHLLQGLEASWKS